MDTIGIIAFAVAIITGLMLGYYFSPRQPKETKSKIPEKLQGNLQRFSDSGFMDVPLAKVNKITHDTYIFTYNLPDPDLPLGLHVGQHIAIHATLPTTEFPQGEEIRRKYTPISKVDQRGTFELLIKVYRKNQHPRFPDGGVLSQYLETLQVGDNIKIAGPLGKLTYHGKGSTNIQRKDTMQNLNIKHFGLICGGTGIAPMYQLIKSVLDNPHDQTFVTVLFGNKSEEDILMREELEAACTDPRIKVYYTVDNGNADWKGFTGFVTKEMLQKTMPAPGKGTLIATCGPGPMNRMLTTQLAELGYPEDAVFKF